MVWPVALSLAAATAVFLLIERRHALQMPISYKMKGDIKRESEFLAQYGQSVATPLAAWLAAIAFGQDWRVFALIVVPVLAASLVCMILKRIFGRMRPNRDDAGRFTGFSWRHSNSRESFPSSHSAAAFALTVALVHLWPQAAIVFWLLATVTAGLRYVMSAHFPSDVIAGATIGVALSTIVFTALRSTLFADAAGPIASAVTP